MNGAHDMGGMHGIGSDRDRSERSAVPCGMGAEGFAITLALGFHGRWNIDAARHARENRHPVDYLSSSYFELWLKGSSGWRSIPA